MAAALHDLVITERRQPETFTNNTRFNFECVLGARLQETEKIFDNSGGRMMSFKIHKSFAVYRRGVDKCGFLCVVYKIAGIDT